MIKQSLTQLLAAYALLAISPSAFAQAPDTLWTRTFGGSDAEYGNSVLQTSDGGFIVAGQTGFVAGQTGSGDVWLVRTNAAGDTLWTRKYGGSGRDEGNSVQQTSDNGFIIAGTTTSYGAGSADAWLIRIDAAGDTIWTKTYGGGSEDNAESVQQTADGGFIITGNTYSHGPGSSDIWLIRVDAAGDTVWTRTFGGPGIELGKSVQQTSDGGFIVTGRLSSFGAIGQADVWLIRTDADGDTLWTRSYAGPGPAWSFEYGNGVQQTADGGFVVVGLADNGSITIGNDVFLIRTDANGDTLWTRAYTGIGSDEGHAIQQTTDGGFIIAGATYSNSTSDTDLLLIRTDAAGDTLWTKILGDAGNDQGYAVQQTADGGFIVVGLTDSYGAGSSDVWLIRLAAETSTAVADLHSGPGRYKLSQNYPNPFNPATTIQFELPQAELVTLRIFDMRGHEVATLVNEKMPAGEHSVNFDGRRLASGIYFYQLRAGEFVQQRKLALVK